MPFQPWWLAVTVRQLTDEYSEGLVLSEGMDSDSSPGPDDLHYALLMRVAADSLAEAQQLVQDAASEFGYLTSELIADRPGAVIRSERKLVAALEPRQVLVHHMFVGFKRDHAEAQAAALRVIRLAISKAPWQFWR